MATNWNYIINSDIEGMKTMLDSINEKMRHHVNGQERVEYIKPIKHMIFEAWSDLCEHGMPTFTEVNNELPLPPQPNQP